jgi:hypothetical protein
LFQSFSEKDGKVIDFRRKNQILGDKKLGYKLKVTVLCEKAMENQRVHFGVNYNM